MRTEVKLGVGSHLVLVLNIGGKLGKTYLAGGYRGGHNRWWSRGESFPHVCGARADQHQAHNLAYGPRLVFA